MNDSTLSKIEYYLSKYELLDYRIEELKLDIIDSEYNQSYNRYISNKSSSLEDQVIHNINIKKKIEKLAKWKKLITKVLIYYKKSEKVKYRFIILKYFNKEDTKTIEEQLKLSYKEQKILKNEILEYIFCSAIKNKMLHREG